MSVKYKDSTKLVWQGKNSSEVFGIKTYTTKNPLSKKDAPAFLKSSVVASSKKGMASNVENIQTIT